MVKDLRNRPLRDLRISLTDRCNMRCRYCMPREHFDSHQFLEKKEILSYEELTLVVQSLIPLGLNKVRLTGGEPLLRKDVCAFISMLPQELDIAMTTNGILLEKYAQELANAGLKRVTVSLDALDIEIFKADHTAYSKKLNKVVMFRDVPDHTKEDFVMLSGTRVREILSAGKDLPVEFARPEVAKILMSYYQQEGSQ